MADKTILTFRGVKAKRATAKALLCLFPDEVERWVPQSQIDDDSEVYQQGDEGDLIVTEWWAIQAEIEDQAE